MTKQMASGRATSRVVKNKNNKNNKNNIIILYLYQTRKYFTANEHAIIQSTVLWKQKVKKAARRRCQANCNTAWSSHQLDIYDTPHRNLGDDGKGPNMSRSSRRYSTGASTFFYLAFSHMHTFEPHHLYTTNLLPILPLSTAWQKY